MLVCCTAGTDVMTGGQLVYYIRPLHVTPSVPYRVPQDKNYSTLAMDSKKMVLAAGAAVASLVAYKMYKEKLETEHSGSGSAASDAYKLIDGNATRKGEESDC
jgi:hypothetical protein